MSTKRLGEAVAINVVANLIAAGIIYLGAQALGDVPRGLFGFLCSAVAVFSGYVLEARLVRAGRTVLGHLVGALGGAVGVVGVILSVNLIPGVGDAMDHSVLLGVLAMVIIVAGLVKVGVLPAFMWDAWCARETARPTASEVITGTGVAGR